LVSWHYLRLIPTTALKVLETIKDFVVEKYPMLQGAVGNIFSDK
jgi:hypothetical protein